MNPRTSCRFTPTDPERPFGSNRFSSLWLPARGSVKEVAQRTCAYMHSILSISLLHNRVILAGIAVEIIRVMPVESRPGAVFCCTPHLCAGSVAVPATNPHRRVADREGRQVAGSSGADRPHGASTAKRREIG